MRTVAGAASHAQEKDPSVPLPDIRQKIGDFLNLFCIDLFKNLNGFG
jgi:hypothetical protein